MRGRTAEELLQAARDGNKVVFHDTIMKIHKNEGKSLLLLHRASAFGWPETLEILLSSRHYNVDERDINGCTPLHVATAMSNSCAVLLLLKAGANVNMANNSGVTALHMVCSRDLLSVIKTQWRDYWQHDSDEEKVDNRRKDVLTTCVLLAADADIMQDNNDGWSSSELARSSQNDGVRNNMKIQTEAHRLDRAVAMMMAIHPRLGENSTIYSFNADIMNLVVNHGNPH